MIFFCQPYDFCPLDKLSWSYTSFIHTALSDLDPVGRALSCVWWFASSKLGFLGSPPGVLLSSGRIAQVHSYDHPGILRLCSHSLNLFWSWFKCYLYECILIVQMYTQNQCIFLYIRFPVYKIYLKETHTHTYIFIYNIYTYIFIYTFIFTKYIYSYIWNIFISCI